MMARNQECNPWTGRRARVVGPLLASALVVAFVLAGPSELAAQGSGPSPEALEALEVMDDKILEAKAKNEGGSEEAARKLIEEAKRAKFQFIRKGFEGLLLHGCRAGLLILDMELIDGNLARALAGGKTLRKLNLGEANRYARLLAEEVEKCGGQRERVIAGQIRDAVGGLRDRHDKGKLTEEKLRKGLDGVSTLKRELIAGQQVYGCDVLDFFLLIERIDKALASAAALPDDAQKLRGSLLRKAAKDSGALIERWRLVPCGGATPPPGPFTVADRLSWFHVNGFGTPPSRECNFVSTNPAQPGAQVTDVITQPAPSPQVTKTATANSSGDAVISMNIDQTGTYTHQTTVTSQGGVQATDTESQTVTSETTGANGQCPAPTP